MINKDTDNKLPIYKLTSKDKVLKYYDDWTKNAQFNQDMNDWKYTAPVNTVQLIDKYINDKNIKILDAGCGSGLVGIEIKGGVEAGKKFITSLKLHYHVANIGDARSLAIHPATTTHSQLTEKELLAAGVTAVRTRAIVPQPDVTKCAEMAICPRHS